MRNPKKKNANNNLTCAALVAAKQFVDTSSANPKTFVYISASAGFPILPKRYITTKRETEELLSQVPDFRTIAMRPCRSKDRDNIEVLDIVSEKLTLKQS